MAETTLVSPGAYPQVIPLWILGLSSLNTKQHYSVLRSTTFTRFFVYERTSSSHIRGVWLVAQMPRSRMIASSSVPALVTVPSLEPIGDGSKEVQNSKIHGHY